VASGIAHDFRNILTSVSGYVEIARELAPTDSAVRAPLARASSGIDQATSLTTKLVAYAGKGELRIGAVALNTVVYALLDLLHGTLVRCAELELKLAAELPPVRGDSTQLHQVVLNLLTNAAEAITIPPGQITVSTDLVELTPALRAQLLFGAEAAPGQHICLRVSDTGGGMSMATVAQMFDPFFTTKVTGRGLGLAAVQGIVRRHQGALRVTSAVGQGTTIAIFLPVAEQTSAHVEPIVLKALDAST
jgi:signal transduction histidine kinase